MDYNVNNTEWDWQGEDYCLQKTSNYDIWNEVTQNEEDLSYMFDESTPAKACGDLAYHVTHNNWEKEPVRRRETSSQAKRRRMLQFDSQMMDSPFCSEEMSSAFLKSTGSEDSIEEMMPDVSQRVSGFPENVSSSSHKYLDRSSEEWLAGCLNDTDMNLSPDDMVYSGASDVQIDMTEFCINPPEVEAHTVHQCLTRTHHNVIFKGRKSYIRTPTKLASSVAYPFAFIKPSGAHGDVTLKDINQRIRTPPPSKSKQTKEDPDASYPTSALTGKPVVVKTKIRTEGGKGSITIMRTKG